MRLARLICFLFLILFCVSQIAMAQWHAVDLHPPGAESSVVAGVSSVDQVGVATISGVSYASRWQGTQASWVNLGGVDRSNAAATDGTHQVGARATSNGLLQAYRWVGTPSSGSYLNSGKTPTNSQAWDTWGGTFVGSAMLNNTLKAVYWPGISGFPIVLHPNNYSRSEAGAIYNGVQGGMADNMAGTWTGSASSFMLRHPPGWTESAIIGIYADNAVGYGIQNGSTSRHALWWNLSTGQWADLHPLGNFNESQLRKINQHLAAGEVKIGPHSYAAVWDINSNVMIDLHSVLPAGQYIASTAIGVWVGANIIYVGGYAIDPVTLESHAMLWYLRIRPG